MVCHMPTGSGCGLRGSPMFFLESRFSLSLFGKEAHFVSFINSEKALRPLGANDNERKPGVAV